MSTSINTGMMNNPLANLARQSAIKTDPGHAPPPHDFRDDTSSDDAFSMDGASDDDSEVVQHIKPAAVKPTLDLKNVPVWDNAISTRDNAQAIKIALGSAGYLDTTKGKGTRQEQMILLAALRHATADYPMALAIVNSISMDSRKCGYTAWKALLTELQGSAMEERKRLEEEITAGQLPNEPVHVYVRRYQNLWNLLNKAHGQWTFEYVAANYLIPGLHPYYDHIVDTTTSAATVNEKLATIISAGQNMEARKRRRASVSQCVARRHANGLRILDDTTPTSTMTNPRYDRHQRAPAERRVNTNYGHHPRDNYRHRAPPGQPFYNDNRNNQDRPQRQQHWTNQGGNDGMQRRQQPVGFVSPAGHQHPGHQQASDTFTQRPTGHQEAYPFVGVSPSAQHHSSLPIMLTCNTTAPGGADTGAQEGEGEDSAEDDLHDPWHVPYSDSYADFETPMDVNNITIAELETLRPVTLIVSGPPCQPWSRAGSRLGWQDHRSRAFASVISFIRFYLTTQPTPVRYIVENVPGALDFPEILSSLGTGNIMRATACGSAAHRETLLWTNIASQTDVQDYINNINAIELTDPGPCAWDLCISEFPHFTPVVTTDYFPKFVARPGSYAFRMQTNGQPGTGMVYEHDGPWS
eukprot:jgi/Tetstr1/458600/TSEL_045003.t1